MTSFRVLLVIAFLLFTTQAFSATVSGEIGSKNSIKKPTTISVFKKPVKKIVIQKASRTVTYISPAGNERINFVVQVKDGIISSVSSVPRATNKISKSLQKSFSKNISKVVVGKKVKNLDIDVVGGASLTTVAFEKFIQKSFKSVSYTHLDVYKRQVYGCIGSAGYSWSATENKCIRPWEKKKMSPREALKDGTWMIQSLNGKNIMSSGTLSFYKNTFSAKLCNTINGRYGVVL